MRRALSSGQLDEALEGLKTLTGAEAGGLWLEAGDWARFVGDNRRARICYTRAAETDAGYGLPALRSLAAVATAEGAHREAARALTAAWEIEDPAVSEPAARARALAEIAFAHLRARQLESARTWLEAAVLAYPERWDARTALVRLAGEDEDRAGVDRWVASAPPVPSHAGGWWMAQGEARQKCGDIDRAAECFEEALQADPESPEPAAGLVRLGVATGREDWIDKGLQASRARAVGAGALDAAFVAAALEVARAGGTEEARRIYTTLRVSLSPRPHAGLDGGWVARWLGVSPEVSERVEVEESGGELPPALQATLMDVGALFGLRGVRGHPAAQWTANPGPPAWIGVPPEGLCATGRVARFWLGRACLAALEPGLSAALAAPADQDPPSLQVRMLDRAGLVAARDPAVALSQLGPRTPRGHALTGFAASATFLELWGVLGLGVRPPLPKARTGA